MSIRSEINRINENVAAAYAALKDLGATMPAELTSDNLAETVKSVSAVLYTAQSLTAAQQEQARDNIGCEYVIGSDENGIYME